MMSFLNLTSDRVWLWVILCCVSLGLGGFAEADFIVTLQPDGSGNAVVSLSTSDATITNGTIGGPFLFSDGGANFSDLVTGDAFGPTYAGMSAGANPALQPFVLEAPLTVNFGGTNYEFSRMEFEDNNAGGTDDDDYAFAFDSGLPSANVSYAVVDTGFSRLLDPDNVLGNGNSAPVPFTDFFAGTYIDPTDTDARYFGGDGTSSVPGMRLVISNTAPEFDCDFNVDTSCNLEDINKMFTQGNLVAGVGVPPADGIFDLAPVGSPDGLIDNADVDEWLAQAAAENLGVGTSPHRRGDTEFDRDVDITDFNTLSINFTPTGDGDPTNGPFWDEANFDGDDDVDITDFNFLSANFAPGGYSDAKGAVPEPTSWLLAVLGGAVVWGSLRTMSDSR